MGTKGLESSFNSKDSTWSVVPAHLSLHAPFLSLKATFYGLVLFSRNFFILIIRQWIKYYEFFR